MKVSEVKSDLFLLFTVFLWRKKEGKKKEIINSDYFFSMSFFPYTVCFALLLFFEFPSFFTYFD